MFLRLTQIPDVTDTRRGLYLNDIGRTHSGCIVTISGEKYSCTGSAVYSVSEQEVYLGVYSVVRRRFRDEERFVVLSDIDTSFPEVGYYNLDKGEGGNKAIMLSRQVARRSWRHSVHKENLSLTLPYLEGSSLSTRLLERGVEVVHPIPSILRPYVHLKEDFLPFSQSYRAIREGEIIGAAISREIAIASDPFSEEVGIFLLGEKVGTIAPGTGQPHVTHNWARPTIEEVCNA